jgi:HemY protein
MIRLVLYILGSLIIAAGAAWAISLPGTVTIEVAGYRLQPGLGAVVVALVVLVLAAIAVWAIIRRLLAVPRALKRRGVLNQKQLGINALSDSFIALQAGDPARARLLSQEAQARLPDNVAAKLLEARADLALGDLTAAREHYRALISNPQTAIAALSGLFEQARAQGRPDVALTFARKARDLAPALPWAKEALFDDLVARRAWDEALISAADEPAPSRADKLAKKRKQAVLHTAIAAEAEPTDPVKALEHALAALKLKPDFVPAALISARIHIDRGEVRKAQSLLRRIWRATGHPHAAALYAHAQPGVSAVERLKKIRDLIPQTPETVEEAVAVAEAAAEAFDWGQARAVLAPFVAENPRQGVCVLMAEIEEGQNADQGKAREWLSRAVKAPRDPAWTADGLVLDEWLPVSPVSGRFDAFVWQVPAEAARPHQVPGPSLAARPEAAGKVALQAPPADAVPTSVQN